MDFAAFLFGIRLVSFFARCGCLMTLRDCRAGTGGLGGSGGVGQ